jgi:hypothetical protein
MDLMKGIGMGARNKATSNHRDIELLFTFWHDLFDLTG